MTYNVFGGTLNLAQLNCSISTLGDQLGTSGLQRGLAKGTGKCHRKFFVGHMYKYAVFDIKPTYNH